MPTTIAAEAAPTPHTGTSRLYRISELMIRYKPAPADRNRFKVLDLETGEKLEPLYDSEDMARASARMRAACEIAALFDGAGQ